MSKNQDVVYIFVKGNKGRFAYEITDHKFKDIYQSVKTDILNDKNEKMYPINTDMQAMLESLNYVKDNRGKNKIPIHPVVFLFTTFELNFHVANALKNPDKNKENVKELEGIKKELARSFFDRDQIKIYWIPKDFENRMGYVEKLLEEEALISNPSRL